MTSLTRPRGPLSSRVYWVRRLAVLGIALLLVVGVARLLSGGSDGADSAATGRARQAAARTTSSAAPTAAPSGATPGAEKSRTPTPVVTGPTYGPTIPPPPVLAEPTGPCTPSDITVTPTVTPPVAGGSDVAITLTLQTAKDAACTWHLSAKAVTVKITSGKDDIWSSQQCPRAIPEQDVVVRNNAPTQVAVVWSARRSDATCSRLTDWALPGWYHVEAAAFGGQPTDLQFELVAPQAPVVTKTITPTPTASPKAKRKHHR